MGFPDSGTKIGGTQSTFRPTLWTVILRAKDPDNAERLEALGSLIQTYWKPIYFFIRRRGSDSETAKDITQGFFSILLERNFLENLDREKGKFRSFLLASLSNYMADEHDRLTAEKRGGGRSVVSLDFISAEKELARLPASAQLPDQIYKREWAIRVMSKALNLLRDHFASKNRLEEFEALRLHLSAGAGDAASYANLAKKLGVGEQDVANRIYRARAKYRETILDVIRSYTESEEDAQAEVLDLFAAFS